jgi:hypothetical protein
MLSFVARFGSSKGMVLVPNLSGLTTAAAISAIQNAGLKFSGSSTSTTSSSSLGDTVFSQSITNGTLVEYETAISFENYVYVPYVPTVTYGDCTADYTVTSSAPGDCISGTFDRYRTTTQYRHRAVFFDGVFQRYDPCSSIDSGEYIPNVSACGYVAPVKTCTSGCGTYTAWSSCQILYGTGGQRTRTRTCTRSDCSTYTQVDTETCCQAGCFGAWSSWASSTGGVQERYRTCQRADCSTYTDYETRCTTRSTTTCGACSKKAPFRKTCTTTTVNSSCTSSSSSSSVAC